jgi:hypothetical protein
MENKKAKWQTQIAAWESDREGRRYLRVIFNEDFVFKKGDAMYLNANKYADNNPKAPQWQKLKKVEEDEESIMDDISPKAKKELPF